MRWLAGTRAVSLATNLPGPMAACRLAELGATVTKIEPPQGDRLAQAYPEWYRAIHDRQKLIVLDLKTAEGMTYLVELLADADLLLTALRPQALVRLGLGWDELHRRFPRLCQVAIVGFPPPQENRPGHDLLYQAVSGLIEPPQLPRALIADYAGAERVVSTAIALLLSRAQTGGSGYAAVSLTEAAAAFADPIRYGATSIGGPLGGSLPTYALYQTRSGWLAIAALEESSITMLRQALNIAVVDHETLQRIFLTRDAKEWEAWGQHHDLPIAALATEI